MDTLKIRRGDDTAFLNDVPTILIDTEDDLTGYIGVLQIQSVQLTYSTEDVQSKELSVVMSHDETLQLTPGNCSTWLKLIDTTNQYRRTFSIPLNVVILDDKVPYTEESAQGTPSASAGATVTVTWESRNITDYNMLSNKPQIEGNILSGNKTFSELGIEPLSTSDIDSIF